MIDIEGSFGDEINNLTKDYIVSQYRGSFFRKGDIYSLDIDKFQLQVYSMLKFETASKSISPLGNTISILAKKTDTNKTGILSIDLEAKKQDFFEINITAGTDMKNIGFARVK